jgi:DNA-binding response OmpR family regulator
MANILCIGLDDSSLAAKRTSLERGGHSISQAKDVLQVIAACSGIRFDAIIIGQNLPAKEKLRVCELVREHTYGAKVIELHTNPEPDLEAADAYLRVGGKSEALVDVVNSVLARRMTA